MRLTTLIVVVTLILCLGSLDTIAQAPNSFAIDSLTVGAPDHVSGAQIDAIGPAGLLSAIATDPRKESAFVWFNANPNNPASAVKTASMSTKWKQDADGSYVAVTRLNTGYIDATGRQWDFLGYVQWGGKGIAIGCNDDDLALAPGRGNIRICGNVLLEGQIAKVAVH